MTHTLDPDPLALTRVEIAKATAGEQSCRICGAPELLADQQLCPACSAWLMGTDSILRDPSA